ncbi:MAG TPA: substrate-binding domain-containing protein [Puia sp.]|nr:substrate-binding domain-containing protein [Puia sp.]
MQVFLRYIFFQIFNDRGSLAVILVLAGSLALAGCSSRNGNKNPQETPISGTINISVDESFKPIIDSQIKVFESAFPDAKVIAHYKSESECIRDLAKQGEDSTRMIIVTRGLTVEEENYYKEVQHIPPKFGVLAYDAVAVIVNNTAKDSIFDMKDIHAMLDGTDKNHQPVMDGLSATSTVRYAIDSILHGQSLGKNVTAARSSEEVINYVAANPRAVGFIGVSWIGDQDDPAQLSFLKKVGIASVRCANCLGTTYVKPYQANIALGRYPLVRGLYYVLKENFNGVGSNFVNFLQYERGQLIFRRAYLVPGKMSFEIRNMQISN